MSIEFELNTDQPIPATAIDEAKKLIVGLGVAELLTDDNCNFSYRWPGREGEEISIKVTSSSIYIAFHVGSRQQRSEFVSVFEQALVQSNITESFQEL